MIGLAWLAVKAWAKGIPLRDWLALAALVAIVVAYLFWAHHERAIGEARVQGKLDAATATIKDLRAQLIQCQDANRTRDAAIARLQMDKATCESGRLADKSATDRAIAAHQANEARLSQAAAARKAKLDELLAGRCKAWADLPACGAEP